MAAPHPRVFNIPASAPFLTVLVDALLSGRLIPGFPDRDDPLALAEATLYLPTRRACRLARDTFLERMPGQAAILPRIVPLGDIDVDEIAFAEAAAATLADDALQLPEVIAPLERRLMLAELILKWANAAGVRGAGGAALVANTPAAALSLASELARLMDDMVTRQVPWSKLDGLVPSDLDPYWQKSLDFLKIARDAWPAMRGERGAIESAERRDMLIEAEEKRLKAGNAPVIAAGSTGSMPATAKLLATIATLPRGAVVLPGLDMTLDEPSWQRIAGHGDDKTHDGAPAASHAQFALQALLTRMGLPRDEVIDLATPRAHGREALVSEALRPAATTEHWQRSRQTDAFETRTAAALDGITVIEAANAEDEALAIAVAIREGLEREGKRIALITPDRALARRTVAALERWQIGVDDSGGDALSDTPAGRFARLATEAALKGLEPVTLLALLKHPLFRLGKAAGAHDRTIATLESALLRGPRPRPGSAALITALRHLRANRDTLHNSDPRRHLENADLDAAESLAAALAQALAPLEALARGDHALSTLAGCHRMVVETLSRDHAGLVTAFESHDGEALDLALQELADSVSAKSLAVARSDYPEVFHAALGDRTVRRPETRDVRVHIYGPLEARLQRLDRVVLGGLNEATWPPETRSDPWLSRPMRRDLGLDPPERRIGLSAHDFAQALGAPEVVMTRAAKLGGAPTVTSRFVQRLAALAGKGPWQQAQQRGQAFLALARALDAPKQEPVPAQRPAPKPPLHARPSKLSVTAIEDWLRDPYTIYAKHILRLFPLDAVDTPPGARDRGTVIHGAIGDYTSLFAKAPPADALAELDRLGRAHFAPLEDYEEAKAFWWPRYQRIAQWFARWDASRRDGLATLHAEIRGEISFPAGERTFTLSGIADRIERRDDGTYAIIDYKTGAARTPKQVITGLAPQLTLEAAMLRENGFAKHGIAPGSISEIVYVTLKGGEPPGKQETIPFKEGTPDDHADRALQKLKQLVAQFENADAPYLSLVHPMWKNHYGDYDHLARVKEWSLTGGADEADE